jgi:hypothetical protein
LLVQAASTGSASIADVFLAVSPFVFFSTSFLYGVRTRISRRATVVSGS